MRREVIAAAEAGRREEAVRIATTKSAEYADSLSQSARQLVAFATGRAEDLQRESLREERISIVVIVFLLAIIMSLSLAIAVYVIGNLRKDQVELARHLYLVDQNVLVSSLDKEGIVQDISSAMCRLLGVTQEEIIGTRTNFFVDEGDKELLEQIARTLKTGKEWRGTFKRMDGEGNVLWLHSTIYPVLDQSYAVSGYNNIIEDVTDKKAIEELSLRDRLTGLHNRRYYEDNIEAVIKTARREKKDLTLAIMDIDFFKNYNDNYGHPAGDQVLFQVANVFKKLLNRPTDHAVRVGGEEFCLCFTGSDREKSIKFLEEIRGEIEALKIKHEYSDVHPYVTVSAGAVVSFGSDIPDKERLYRQADEALYKAKKKRNTLVVA
ncbi:MAG: diguanylate cyclase [Syntrophales bacterium]|nr:diguanylate cyclase [Syntrophales bacterium]